MLRLPVLRLLALGWVAWSASALAAESFPRAAPATGVPLIRTVTSADSGLVNFETLCLGSDGRLFVGALNGGGLRVFDGVRWSAVAGDWPNSAIGMLVRGGDGTVWAGCLDEVGCITGAPARLVSRLHQLPPDQRQFGNLRNGVPVPDGAVLTSTTHAVHCSAAGLRLWKIPEGVGAIFLSGGRPTIRVRDGDRSFRQLRDGQWERLEAAEPDAPGALAPLPQTPETKAWLAAQRVTTRERLPDGRVLFGTRQAGLVIVGTDGRIEEHFTAADGLASDLIYGTAVDRQGGVWVTHHSVLCRLDLRPRIHGPASGLRALATGVVRAEGRLTILSPQGTRVQDASGRFVPLPGGESPGYDVLQRGDEWLWSGFPPGVLRDGVVKALPPSGFRDITKWTAEPARPDVAYGGGERDIFRFERRDGTWVAAELLLRGTASTSDLVATGDGWLWQASNWIALQRLDLRQPAATRAWETIVPRTAVPKPSRGLIYALRCEERLLVASWQGFLRWDEAARRLQPDPELTAFAFPGSPGTALANAGTDWFAFQEDAPPGRVRLVERGAGGRWTARETSGGLLRGVTPESIFFDRPTARIWLTDGDRVLGLDATREAQPVAGAVTAAVRSARDSRGVLRHEEGAGALELPPERREAVLEFAANDYEISLGGRPALEFRSRLTGFDVDWSPWSVEAKRGYTNLPPGQYAFEVEARTLAGELVRAVPLPILVPARWWETAGARVGMGLGGALLLALVTARWAQRRLRERVRRLNVEAALQQERLRIARDMHDGLGSMLGRLQLTVDRASGHEDPAERARMLAEAGATTRELAAHTREIIWAVTPENDTLDNLLDRLAETVQAAAQAAGLRCRLDLPAESQPLPVHATMRHQVLLAVKEAVHNAVKHAHASELRLRAAWSDGRLEVELADDGCGFDPSGGGRPGGLGLDSLRARAAALQGEARIESAAGGGTRVCFRIPLAAAG